MRELEAIEAAKPAEQRRREQEQADAKPSSRACLPASRCCSEPISWSRNSEMSPIHARRRRKAVRFLTSEPSRPARLQHRWPPRRCQGWPPRHGDFARIEWPNMILRRTRPLSAPLRQLARKAHLPKTKSRSRSIARKPPCSMNSAGCAQRSADIIRTGCRGLSPCRRSPRRGRWRPSDVQPPRKTAMLRPSKPEPRRRRQRDEQPIPRDGDVFDWRPNEFVLGGPRPARRAREAGNA